MDAFAKVSVEDIVQDLNTRENAPVLFLGSRTGSLFRGTALANALKGYSWGLANKTRVERFSEWYKALDGLRQNENVTSRFPGNKQPQNLELHSIIRDALKEKSVAFADTCLAQFMKERKFEYIITTNIGNEEELTFLQNDMNSTRDFEVIAPGPARDSMGNKFKIIKASGDITTNYSICGYTIVGKDILLDMYDEPKKSIDGVKKRDMLMVGFDAKWDNHVLHAVFPREGGRVWYVNEEPTIDIEKNSQLFFYLKACKALCLEGHTGKYESFFTNLCVHMLDSIPTQQLLDKLISIEKTLLEMQNTRQTHQQLQEMTMKDIKESIAKLSENVDVLLKCCNNTTPKSTSRSINDPLNTYTNGSSTTPERKTGRTRKSKAV